MLCKNTWGYSVYRRNSICRWTSLDRLSFRKVYYGVTANYVMDKWQYNHHLDCYVYYTENENFDAYSDFVNKIISPLTP